MDRANEDMVNGTRQAAEVHRQVGPSQIICRPNLIILGTELRAGTLVL